jgi:hypothetical protein
VVLGRECRVRAAGVAGANRSGEFLGIEVDIPHRYWPSGFFVFQEHNLEPILPEGMKPARWEGCAWQPDAEVVTESAPTQRIADEVSLALETIALTGRRV